MRTGARRKSGGSIGHTLGDILLDGVLLLLVLLGTVSSFVSAYSIRPAPELFVCCAGLSVVFTVAFVLPRRRWIPLLILGVGYALFVWHRWDEIKAGAFAVYADIVNLLAKQLHITEPIALPSKLTPQKWDEVQIFFLIMAAALLAFMLGWAIVDRHSTCLTIVLTLAPLMPALLANVLPWWPAFMATTACWLVLLLTSLLRGTSANGLYRFAASALLGCAALLFLLSVCMPQADYRHPAWTNEAYVYLTELGSRIVSQLTRNSAVSYTLPGSSATVSSSMTVDLASAGPLQYTGDTVLRITAETPGRVYLRGYAAARYNGTSWLQLSDEEYQSFSQMFDTDWRGINQPAYFPFFTNTLSTPPYSIDIENIAAPRSCVYYPSQLIPSSGDGTVNNASFVRDIYLSPYNGARTYTFYYYPPDELLRGTESRMHEAEQTEMAYRYFVYQNYTDFPSDFLDDIAPWLQEAEQLSRDYKPSVESIPELYRERVAAAWKVAYMLDVTTEYDAETPTMPQGADFVIYFLTQSRRGYCMHFASAATLLLRSMGIPARYVGGYAATMLEPGTFDIPDSAAHVWIEIYLDGYGWHPVEVTPAIREDPVLQDTAAEPLPEESPVEPPQDDTADHTAPEKDADSVPPTEEQVLPQKEEAANLRWMLYPAVLALTAAILVLRRLYLRWLRRRKTQGTDINGSALNAYGYLLRLQPWGLRKNEEIERLAQKARFSQHTLTQDEHDTILRWLEAEELRIDQSLPLWKRLLFRYLFGLH